MQQFLTVPAVKRNPRTVATIGREGNLKQNHQHKFIVNHLWTKKSHLQLHPRRQHDRPEAERMRTNRRHQNGRHRRMNHRRSGRRRVGRTTGGRGHDQPIALHRRNVLPVQKQIDVGQVRRHAPIDDDLVEDLEIESELLKFELQEAF